MTGPARPSLSDGVVTIRPIESADVDGVFEAAAESIADISPWMEWSHPGYDRSETAEWIEAQPALRARGDMPMLVVGAGDGAVLGSAGVNDVDAVHRSCNVGYWIRTSAAGRGFAVRAARLSVIYALTDMDLVRAEIVVDLANARSVRVAEKLGAAHEGIARHRLYHHGAAHDAHVFSLTRDDLDRLCTEAGLGP